MSETAQQSDVVETFEGLVEGMIDAEGIYPFPAYYIDSNDERCVASLAMDNAQICVDWFWSTILTSNARELIFGVDRETRPNQGTEFADVLTCAYYVQCGDTEAIRDNYRINIGVINYQHEPRIVRPIDWDNRFWRRQLLNELNSSPVSF